jgi:hypothetical protein
MARWLGLAVEEEGVKGHTPSSTRQPEELPSVEEASKILAGALQAASQAGLDKAEMQRLQAIGSPRNSQPELSV